jgi:hypothetical protein
MPSDWNHERDPLLKYGRPLIAVLLAVIVSLLVAALIGGAMPFDYAGRAWTYIGLVAYVITGAVVVFRRFAAGERHALSVGRLLKWIVALWLWPALTRRPGRSEERGG